MPRPVFHAIQYLAGNQTREKLENFRGYKGAQSYPSRTKDIDDVDFSTGSVGLGVAQTLFSSLVQDYVSAHGWLAGGGRPHGRAGRRCRDGRGQHLRGAARGLEARPAQHLVGGRLQPPEPRRRGARGPVGAFEKMFRNFGWDVVILKHGCCNRRPSPSRAARRCATGSTPAPTSSIRR
jgi:pyruvate dehydrogenase E1 component